MLFNGNKEDKNISYTEVRDEERIIIEAILKNSRQRKGSPKRKYELRLM